MSNRLLCACPWGGFGISPEAFSAAVRAQWPSARPTSLTEPHKAITALVDNGRSFEVTLFLDPLLVSGDGSWQQLADVYAWYAGLNELPGPTRLLVLDMSQTVKAEIGPGMTGAGVLAALEPVDVEDDYFENLPWV